MEAVRVRVGVGVGVRVRVRVRVGVRVGVRVRQTVGELDRLLRGASDVVGVGGGLGSDVRVRG